MVTAADVKKLRRYSPLQLAVGALVALCLVVGIGASLYNYPQATLRENRQTVRLDLAVTKQAQRQGLSGRASMPDNRGLLFVFKEPGRYCFWMKDMRFPIDIVWLDDRLRVIYMVESVTPASYPREFCPTQPATNVIELNAGQASRLDIKLGDTLNVRY